MNCEYRVALQNRLDIFVQGTSSGRERSLETKTITGFSLSYQIHNFSLSYIHGMLPAQ